MTQQANNNNAKPTKESILRVVNRIALPHIIVCGIMLLIILYYFGSFCYLIAYRSSHISLDSWHFFHEPLPLLYRLTRFQLSVVGKPVMVLAVMLAYPIFKAFSFWWDWRIKVRQALLADNMSDLTIRLIESRGHINVEYFDEPFPRRKFINDVIFRETPVNDQLGHKIPARVYIGIVWSTPVAIETEKSFLLVGFGSFHFKAKELIAILERAFRFK
jgi:hypothetical protein